MNKQPGPELSSRRARAADCAAASVLYFETVHQVNARDYSAAKRMAWAPCPRPAAFWRRRWRQRRVWLTERDGRLLGFAELQGKDHVDAFYVHHEYLGQGTGRSLMGTLIAAARRLGAHELSADVSLTAEPFFRRMGFRVTKRRFRVYRGRCFRQARMVRRL